MMKVTAMRFCRVAAILLITAAVAAQTPVRIEIVNANTLAGTGNVKKLLGNVVLRQDNTTMTCDSAYLFDGDSRFEGFGNVFMNQADTTTLAGDKVTYDAANKVAVVTGKVVKLRQGNMSLTTDRLDYNMKTKEAVYTTGARMLNGDNTLTSRQGTYYSGSHTMIFRQQVVLTNPDYVMKTEELRYNTQTEVAWFAGPTKTVTTAGDTLLCRSGWYDTRTDISSFGNGATIASGSQRLQADSLWYNRRFGVGKAFRQIVFTDTAEHVQLSGNTGHYWQKTHTATVTDSALAIQVSDGDSIFIHADTLHYADDSSRVNGRHMTAYKGVRVYKSDLQAVADSLAYNSADSTITLYQHPVLWHKENQLTADTILVYRSSKGIDSLQLRQNSFICSRETGQHFNQIKGQHITGLFDSSELRLVLVLGQGESIYYIKEDSLHYTGINHITCNHMAIALAGKEVQGIRFYTDNKGELLPVNSVQATQNRLSGFTWQQQRPGSPREIW